MPLSDVDGYFFCGLPAAFTTEDLRRDPVARWHLAGGLSRIDRDTLRPVVQAAFNAWSAVSGVEGIEGADGNADIVIQIAQIDGPQGVLADCQLPGPRVQRMRLDDAELWVIQSGNGIAGNVIDAGRVLVHELGHFWGMGHAPQGSPNLMAPTYARSIWLPQSWEIEQMQSRYGKPRARKPDPGNSGSGTGDTPAEIWIKSRSGKWLAGYTMGERIA